MDFLKNNTKTTLITLAIVVAMLLLNLAYQSNSKENAKSDNSTSPKINKIHLHALDDKHKSLNTLSLVTNQTNENGHDLKVKKKITPSPLAFNINPQQALEYNSNAAVAQLLTSQFNGELTPLSEYLVQQISDETIEEILVTGLAEKTEHFNRHVNVQLEMDQDMFIGLRMAAQSQVGTKLLLNLGLLQNDIVIGVNETVFSSLPKQQSLAYVFIVNLLTEPESNMLVNRGGSLFEVNFTPPE